MPIRINLLHEALAEAELRRRDPVKRAMYVGVFLVVLSLVWFSSIWMEGKIIRQSLDRVEIEIDSNSGRYNDAQVSVKKMTDCQHRLNALLQLSAGRFLQGNLLNALGQVYVPNVQLVDLKLNQSFNDDGGTPDTVTTRTTLTLDGKDSSPNLDQMSHYKEALAKLDYFKSKLDPTNGLKLSSLSSAQTSADGKPYVLFTLDCHFTDQTRK